MQCKQENGSPFTLQWPPATIPAFLGGGAFLPQWPAPMQTKPPQPSSESTGRLVGHGQRSVLLLGLLLFALLIALGVCVAALSWYLQAPESNALNALGSAGQAGTVRPHHPRLPHFQPTKPASSAESIPLADTSEEPASDEDGFGESEQNGWPGAAAGASAAGAANHTHSPSDEEALLQFFLRFNSTRSPAGGAGRLQPDPLDGEFVEHRTMGSEEMSDEQPAGDLFGRFALPTPSVGGGESGELSDESLLSRPAEAEIDRSNYPGNGRGEHAELAARAKLDGLLPLRRFCGAARVGCEPRALVDCGSKFVVLARAQLLAPNASEPPAALGDAVNSVDPLPQLHQVYTLQVQRVLRRSPLLSVGLRRSQLHVQLSMLPTPGEPADQPTDSTLCAGRPVQLQPDRLYLLSGRVSGLHAVSRNCDLRLDWDADLRPAQQAQLLQALSEKGSADYC